MTASTRYTGTLTAADLDLIRTARDEWMSTALALHQPDRDTAAAAVRNLYSVHDLPAPLLTIWMDSPLGAIESLGWDRFTEQAGLVPVGRIPGTSKRTAELSCARVPDPGNPGQYLTLVRTLTTGALLAELGRRLHEYENADTWNTTCLSCQAVLDAAYAETARREAAEAKLAAIGAYCRKTADHVADDILDLVGELPRQPERSGGSTP